MIGDVDEWAGMGGGRTQLVPVTGFGVVPVTGLDCLFAKGKQ